MAARLQISWIKGGTDPEMIEETMREVSEIIREAIDSSRSLAVDLNPPALQEGGLIAGIKWLAADIQKKNQFTVHFQSDSRAEPGWEDMRTLLFECVREMLLNSMKHAGVCEARVTLLKTDDNQIQLIVSDEGKGFDPDLLEMQAR